MSLVKIAAQLINRKGSLSLIEAIKKSYSGGQNLVSEMIEKNRSVLDRIKPIIKSDSKFPIIRTMNRRINAVEIAGKRSLRKLQNAGKV